MNPLRIEGREGQLNDGRFVLFIKFWGSIDYTKVEQIETFLQPYLQKGISNMVLIFSDVQMANSTGLGLLINTAHQLDKIGGKMILVEVPKKFKILFEMMDLLSIFHIYDDEHEAIAVLNTENLPGSNKE